MIGFSNIVSFSIGPSVEILLILESERYTIYCDMGRKFGQACIQNNCIADMHTLCFYSGPVDI